MKHLFTAAALVAFASTAHAGNYEEPVVVPAPVVAEAAVATSSVSAQTLVILSALIVMGVAASTGN